MSDEITVREIAEALVCLAKILQLLDKILPEFVPTLLELEDELTDYMQELR